MARVRDLMRRDFIRVSASEDPASVFRLMGMARVRALPVLDGPRLAGMVCHRDLARAALGEAASFSGRSLAPFVRAVAPVSSDAPLAEAARRMVGEETPCLAAAEPDGGAVVGLVTEGDLLRAAYRPSAPR